jgi:putative spermidine/putrescine transport system substrate-binding protein
VLALLACVAACALLIASCGGDDETGANASADSAAAGPFDNLSGTVTWYDTAGGTATNARRDVVLPAFRERTGVETRQDYNADTTKLFAALESGGDVTWNVIEFPAVGDFLRAKEAGHLVPLDPKVVPVDKLDESAYDEFGIKGERYGIMIAWNTEVWPESGNHPTSIVDIYNTDEFPGKRCLLGYPAFGAVLESALIADGVPRESLYPLDVDRALAKLDTIKDQVVWYERDAAKLLISGECDMAITWSGQIYTAVTKDDAPLAISWDDALYAEGVFAIPKTAKDLEAAQAMLAFLILDEPSRDEFVRLTAYPIDIKGVTYPDDLQPWLPVGKDIISENAEYYQEHLTDLSERFTKWLGS